MDIDVTTAHRSCTYALRPNNLRFKVKLWVRYAGPVDNRVANKFCYGHSSVKGLLYRNKTYWLPCTLAGHVFPRLPFCSPASMVVRAIHNVLLRLPGYTVAVFS